MSSLATTYWVAPAARPHTAKMPTSTAVARSNPDSMDVFIPYSFNRQSARLKLITGGTAVQSLTVEFEENKDNYCKYLRENGNSLPIQRISPARASLRHANQTNVRQENTYYWLSFRGLRLRNRRVPFFGRPTVIPAGASSHL